MASRPTPDATHGFRRLRALAGLAVLVVACDFASPPRAALSEVTLPRLDDVTVSTRQALEARHAAVTAALRERREPRETALAFGELGMRLLAAEFFDAAATSFQNATLLSPDEARWTYYLAHAHRNRGDAAAAAAGFERTLAIDPGQMAAAWWLGSVYLELGRAADAQALFGRTQAAEGFQVAALHGLGRAALAQGRYEDAVLHLERALTLSPGATSARYPLGLAYQKLGRPGEAEAQLRYRSTSAIRPPDALIDALDGLVESPVALHSQGVAASLVGDWNKAADLFGRAVALDPGTASAHLNLAVALHHAGSHDEALAAARRAIALAPREARAYLIAGTVLASLGRDDDSVSTYIEGTRADPRFAETHAALADLLRRRGRHREALARYAVVLELRPDSADAQFGSALALVRLGRHGEARDRLVDGMAAHPDEARFPHALARVLATAPAAVGDGARALALVEKLMTADPTVDRATTMAMALAAVGRHADAAAWQRQALDAADAATDPAVLAGMRRNLAAFERGQAVSEPWPADDPVHRPAPRVAPGPID